MFLTKIKNMFLSLLLSPLSGDGPINMSSICFFFHRSGIYGKNKNTRVSKCLFFAKNANIYDS